MPCFNFAPWLSVVVVVVDSLIYLSIHPFALMPVEAKGNSSPSSPLLLSRWPESSIIDTIRLNIDECPSPPPPSTICSSNIILLLHWSISSPPPSKHLHNYRQCDNHFSSQQPANELFSLIRCCPNSCSDK